MAQSQDSQDNLTENSELSLRRVQILSDGIFVLAMTLMVLQFDLPDPAKEMTNLEIKKFLLAQLPDLGIYIITFVLIAFYWFEHLNQFQYYRKTDPIHLWLQLFSLMGIVLIPYSNDLATLYPDNLYVQIVYSLNLFWVGIFFYFNWVYATKNRRLVSAELDDGEISAMKAKALIEPAIALLAVPAALIKPWLWEVTFLLVPVAYIFLETKSGSLKKKKDIA